MTAENKRSKYKTDSRLERILAEGEFAVCGEMGPPRGADADDIREKAADFLGYVDVVNLTDNQTAIVRMSSIAASYLAYEEGLEPVVQMTCRDRNRLAQQADLIGAYAMGLKNILCLSGDHQVFGDHDTAKNVYDIDSLNLLQMMKMMRDEGKFMSGEDLTVEPRFFIGAAANPFGDPFEYRVIRLAKKIRAGADFIQTQAIYDLDRFKEWMDIVRKKGLHEQVYILAGVLPPKSAGALRYMKNNVSGMRIPSGLIQRLDEAEDPAEEGIKICVELIEELKDMEGIHGVHIMPVMWESVLPTLVERAGLLPRPEL